MAPHRKSRYLHDSTKYQQTERLLAAHEAMSRNGNPDEVLDILNPEEDGDSNNVEDILPYGPKPAVSGKKQYAEKEST